MLFRVFPVRSGTTPDPLAVPRAAQGAGRHDNPDEYTALYLSRDAVSAVAERMQAFRGVEMPASAFARPDGSVLALAAIDDAGWPDLVDLDDPAVLAAHRLRPSFVATGDRPRTQRIALDFFRAGALGLSWWSTLEASWTNVTVFREHLATGYPIRSVTRLTLRHVVVREAAERLGVGLPSLPRGRGLLIAGPE